MRNHVSLGQATKSFLRRLTFIVLLFPVFMLIPLACGLWWLLTGKGDATTWLMDYLDWGMKP